MKHQYIIFGLALVLIVNNGDAIGYKPDPMHSFEHKEDIERLLHPNHQIHVVKQHRTVREAKNEFPLDDESDNERILDGKALLMGMKNNVVTNILEASAAVERESVLKFDSKKK